MRNRLLVGVITALTISSAPSISGSLNYTMTNNTDQPIVRIWASPTTASVFVESTNVYVPANGGSQRQTFDTLAYGSSCFYDIQVQFQGGDRAVINHIDLCHTFNLTVEADDDGGVTYVAN
jgi:hypothetical protein